MVCSWNVGRMGSLVGAGDRDYHAAVGGVAGLVFGGGGVLAAGLGQVGGATAFCEVAAHGVQAVLVEQAGHRFGAFLRQFGVDFARADGVGVAHHLDAVDAAVARHHMLGQVFNGFFTFAA